MKTISVKVEGKLVTVQLDALSKRAWEAELGKMQHQKYLLEKKKNAVDLQAQRLQFEITQLEQNILALNTEECKKLLKEAEEKKELDIVKRHIAQLNAEQIMLEFFGQDVHDKFMEERQFVFEAKDEQTYKITTEGTVFQKR